VGHSGIYRVIAEGQKASYYTHWGAASVFSVFRRLQCAIVLKEGEYADKNMTDIFEHLGVDASYTETADRADLMFERLSLRAKRLYEKDFDNDSYLEMRITLNLDTNTAFIEHNPRYGSYKYVGNFYIPIDHGLYNLNSVLNFAEKTGLDDIWKIASVFERHTGLTHFYNKARTLREQTEKQKKSGQHPHEFGEKETSAEIPQKLEDQQDQIDFER
jgi:hypothetical protein